MPNQRFFGFTLIEMMIALAVMSIIFGIAVPSFQTMITNARVSTAMGEMSSAVALARSEAIKRDLPICITPGTATTASTNSSFAKGWSIWVDTPGNNCAGTPGVAAIIKQHEPLNASVAFSQPSNAAPPSYISFNGQGFLNPRTQIYLYVCPSPRNGLNGYVVALEPSGVTDVETNTTCP